ncbi:porin-like protein [Limnobacter thiooxidans]|uniref:Porin domain-containing protein n=1 Tax=Limnobacter thiooxidans TaxID=131080 RepID=A0AA86MCJ8_9BURK|nr:porin [Limnobacter sp.]MCZ8016889.1 porin [Limnobacter sp.]RZS38609.1 porin-like protein [Limnobacter thiooxidans]BET24941.1 hypothetical protein RGQ30_04420 [Limnobacter thiooxidans]
MNKSTDLLRYLRTWAHAAALLTICGPALAIDYSLSGFGTVQYTIGDNQEKYLRHVNEDGTLKVNSILGGQLDVQLNDEFSATVQYVVSPKQRRDEGVELDNRWAFLKFKPNDNWHFKLGRQRLNLYMDSENLDVGHTYVPANLSPEIYYDAGVLAADGFSANYNFEDSAGRYWGVQAITGNQKIVQRLAGFNQDFPLNDFEIAGLVLSLEGDDYRLHLSHHGTEIDRGISQINGIPLIDGRIDATARLTNLGAEYRWDLYTLRGEISQTEIASSASGVLFPGTPRLAVSNPKFEEHGANLLLTRRVFNQHAVYGSYGRFISEFDDQYSLAIGGKYNLSPSDSIKLELQHVVEKSNRQQLSDNRIPNTTFNFLSVSYNWVWE